MDEWKRSGQIPAFGDWEHANEMPITQYFESARQAGLIRYSSSGECDQYIRRGGADLYASDFKKPSRELGPPKKTRVSRERNRAPSSLHSHGKEQKKQGKVFDVTEPPRKQHQYQQQPIPMYSNVSDDKKDNINGVNLHHPRPKFPVVRPSKAVDEDLYKIPPELLRSSKRKKIPGFFSCLVPACAS